MRDKARLLTEMSQARRLAAPGGSPDQPRRPRRARLAVAVAVLLLLLGIAGLLVCRATRQAPESAEAVVYMRGQPDSRASLERRADRWVGRSSDFPVGSVAHVQPRDAPGFFVVHSTSGVFWALADRSPHRGQPLEYRDPLPGTASHVDGPQPGFYDPEAGANHTLDGRPFEGSAPRPLDPFPMVLNGDQVEVATHAFCPDNAGPPLPEWCSFG